MDQKFFFFFWEGNKIPTKSYFRENVFLAFPPLFFLDGIHSMEPQCTGILGEQREFLPCRWYSGPSVMHQQFWWHPGRLVTNTYFLPRRLLKHTDVNTEQQQIPSISYRKLLNSYWLFIVTWSLKDIWWQYKIFVLDEVLSLTSSWNLNH